MGTISFLFATSLLSWVFTRRAISNVQSDVALLSNKIDQLTQSKGQDNVQVKKSLDALQASSTQEVGGSLNLYYRPNLPYRGWHNFVLYHRTGPDTEEVYIPDVRQAGISDIASSTSLGPIFTLNENEILFGTFSSMSVFDPVDMYALNLSTKKFRKMKSKYFQEHVRIENNDGYFLSMGPTDSDGEVRSLYFVNVYSDKSGIIAKLPANLTYKKTVSAFMPVVQGFGSLPEGSGPPEVSIEVYPAAVKGEGEDERLPVMLKSFAMESPWF